MIFVCSYSPCMCKCSNLRFSTHTESILYLPGPLSPDWSSPPATIRTTEVLHSPSPNVSLSSTTILATKTDALMPMQNTPSTSVPNLLPKSPSGVKFIVSPYNGGRPPLNASILWTHEDLESLPPELKAKERYPDVIIIGARKAGTSALLTFLSLHPQIMSRPWEDGFFSRDDYYALGLEKWLQTQPVHTNKVLLTKTAEYLHRESVPSRMYAINASTKFIAILREPISRMISDYQFLQRYEKAPDSPEKSQTFDELALKNGTVDGSWGCYRRSLYVKHLTTWQRWFPKEQILIINGDKFTLDDPRMELQRVESFLNLKPFFFEGSFYFNQTKGFYCHVTYGCLGEGKGHEPLELNPSTENILKNHFKGLNDALYKLINQDFNW